MRRFVGSFVLCFAFGLSLDRVVGYADWSHTFWSCKDLGQFPIQSAQILTASGKDNA